MKVVLFSVTPVAGSPWQQYQCLKKYSNLGVRLIYQRARYADGRTFPFDMLYNQTEAQNVIRQADVIHIHNSLPPFLSQIIDRRRQVVVGTLHSVPRQGNWQDLYRYADKTVCIRQPYQVKEYKELSSLPNLFDIFQHQMENSLNSHMLNIIFAPSNRYPLNHPASKGYQVIVPILKRFSSRYRNVKFTIIENKSYLDNLEIKKTGHIIIDDLISEHNTFHLTSLEGASLGKVVLTSIGKEQGYPFVRTNLKTLEKNLIYLVNNPKEINKIGNESRNWIIKNWNPREQVREYENFYETLYRNKFKR